jgi:hypothetical protein
MDNTFISPCICRWSIFALSSPYASSHQGQLFPQSDAPCDARMRLAARPSSTSVRRPPGPEPLHVH